VALVLMQASPCWSLDLKAQVPPAQSSRIGLSRALLIETKGVYSADRNQGGVFSSYWCSGALHIGQSGSELPRRRRGCEEVEARIVPETSGSAALLPGRRHAATHSAQVADPEIVSKVMGRDQFFSIRRNTSY
jgi:hypothetical protein